MSFKATVRRNRELGEPIAWPGDAGGPGAPWAPAGGTDFGGPERGGDAEAVLRQAHEAGFREGEAAGRAQAQAALHAVVERMTRSIQELAALRPRLREQAEGDLIRLAVAIARRVVRRELAVDPGAIAGLVKAALAQLAAQEAVRVRVHPEHEAAVRACLAATSGAENIEVAGDASLERGSAVF